jgi:hypothetical protein
MQGPLSGNRIAAVAVAAGQQAADRRDRRSGRGQLQPLGKLGPNTIKPSIQKVCPFTQMVERCLVWKEQIVASDAGILFESQTIDSSYDRQLSRTILEIGQLPIELSDAGLEVLVDPSQAQILLLELGELSLVDRGEEEGPGRHHGQQQKQNRGQASDQQLPSADGPLAELGVRMRHQDDGVMLQSHDSSSRVKATRFFPPEEIWPNRGLILLWR